MAQTKAKQKDPKKMTWQEKLEAGVPLNVWDEIKADADFNYHQRRREEEARLAFEKLKAAGRGTPEAVAAMLESQDETDTGSDSGEEGEDK